MTQGALNGKKQVAWLGTCNQLASTEHLPCAADCIIADVSESDNQLKTEKSGGSFKVKHKMYLCFEWEKKGGGRRPTKQVEDLSPDWKEFKVST